MVREACCARGLPLLIFRAVDCIGGGREGRGSVGLALVGGDEKLAIVTSLMSPYIFLSSASSIIRPFPYVVSSSLPLIWFITFSHAECFFCLFSLPVNAFPNVLSDINISTSVSSVPPPSLTI
jgi:hypothetical protein